MNKIMTLMRGGAVVSLLALLAGCGGGAAQMHYFNLPPMTKATTVKHANSAPQRLTVSPVNLSSYISGDGIVYQTSPVEYNQAQLNLWADDLSEQLTDQLRTELAQQLGYFQVLPANANTNGADHLNIQIDQFQGRYDGNAIIKGSYQLYDDDQHLLMEKPIDVSVPLHKDGYDALVTALGQGWQQAAQQMGVSLDSHATSTPVPSSSAGSATAQD